MRMIREAFTCAAAAAILMLATSAPAATPCDADVRVTAKSDQTFSDSILKVWAVEADTQAACAQVYVDVTVTERLFNGEEITSTRRGSRKVTGGTTTTFKVNYRIAPDSTLTDWKFKVARCAVCGTE